MPQGAGSRPYWPGWRNGIRGRLKPVWSSDLGGSTPPPGTTPTGGGEHLEMKKRKKKKMTDNVAEGTETETPAVPVEGAEAQADPGEVLQMTQAEFDAKLAARLARVKAQYRDYSEVKRKAAEFDQLEEQSKTELQKATERAERLESELRAREFAATRAEVAAAAGLPADLAGRLRGETREELEADAVELAKAFAARAPKPTPAQSGENAAPAGDWLRSAIVRKR